MGNPRSPLCTCIDLWHVVIRTVYFVLLLHGYCIITIVLTVWHLQYYCLTSFWQVIFQWTFRLGISHHLASISLIVSNFVIMASTSESNSAPLEMPPPIMYCAIIANQTTPLYSRLDLESFCKNTPELRLNEESMQGPNYNKKERCVQAYLWRGHML